MNVRSTFTLGTSHGYQEGDVLHIEGGRWAAVRAHLTRPRINVVIAATATTVEMEERHMTWSEWLAAWRGIWW